jgi:hypothetical protein
MQQEAVGFTWLTRQGEQPLQAVQDLVKVYLGKASIDFGELPAYLDPLKAIAPSQLEPQPPIAVCTLDLLASAKSCLTKSFPQVAPASLEERVSAWAGHLWPVEAAVALADLLAASKASDIAIELLELRYEHERHQEVAALGSLEAHRHVVGVAWLASTLGLLKQRTGKPVQAEELCKAALASTDNLPGLLDELLHNDDALQVDEEHAMLRDISARTHTAVSHPGWVYKCV